MTCSRSRVAGGGGGVSRGLVGRCLHLMDIYYFLVFLVEWSQNEKCFSGFGGLISPFQSLGGRRFR